MAGIINTWGRPVLSGYLFRDAEQDGMITMTYIRGIFDALDVAYMIDKRSSGYVNIRVDCSDDMYTFIMNKINKYYLNG